MWPPCAIKCHPWPRIYINGTDAVSTMDRIGYSDVMGFGGGVGCGLAAGEAMAQVAPIKQGTAFENVHHYQLGLMAMPLGTMVPAPVRTLFYGTCLGLVLHDIKDLINGGKAATRWPMLYGPRKAPAWSPAFQRYQVPEHWSRRQKYQAVANIIKETVQRDRKDPQVREMAIHATRGVDGRDTPNVVERIQHYVHRNVRYVKDPKGVQVIQAVAATKRLKAGKCVDQSIMVSSMLGSIGVPTCGLLYAQGRPGMYDHIISGVMVDDDHGFPVGSVTGEHPVTGQSIIPVETIIQKGVPLGWEPHYKSRAIINYD